MSKNLKYYLKKAQAEGWAIGQFNFSDLSQLKGIVAAAQKLRSPVILGTSEGEVGYLGVNQAISLVSSYLKESKLPLYLNLDHGHDLSYLKKVAFSGYHAVHFDGSNLFLEENISISRKLVAYCRPKGVIIEGEVGSLKGTSELHGDTVEINKGDLTDPLQAEEFAKKTIVDSLAVSIGNVHGVYQQMPQLDYDRLKEVKKRTKVFLVLHGGSGYSGQEIKEAIKDGIVKVNINTELRMAWRQAVEAAMKQSGEMKPYKILSQAAQAVQQVVEEKILIFGSNNKI